MITILNTSILTNYGTFEYMRLSLDSAIALVHDRGYESAVGHQATAEIISTLLGVPVDVNRVIYRQQPGQEALVFKLNGRSEEGKILTVAEIEEKGYEFGLLTRIDSR